MPRYRATEPGFYNGRIYSPTGKRPVLAVAEPLDPVPSWLEPIPYEGSQEEAEAIAQLKADEQEQKLRSEEAQAAAKVEIDAVSFVEDPKMSQDEVPAAPGESPSVETLS